MSVQRCLAKAGEALTTRQFAAAQTALDKALAIAPASVEVRRLRGICLLMQRRWAEAETELRKALDLQPDSPLTLMNLGAALFEQGQAEVALEMLRRACERAPRVAPAWFNLGKVLMLLHRAREARNVVARALTLAPSHMAARQLYADILVSLGDAHGAATEYRMILKQQPTNAAAWVGLANLKSIALEASDAQRIHQALAQDQTNTRDQIALEFALGTCLENQNKFGEAYAAFKRANMYVRRSVNWDAARFHRRIDEIRHAFATPVAAAPDPSLGQDRIFLVSMPRAGSSLVEQILASQPRASGAGELMDVEAVIADESTRREMPFPKWAMDATPECWERLGKEYLARTEKWCGARPVLIDKGLGNWIYVGAICAMLPGAKIVHVRRDPLENCFGCFRQLFVRGCEFTYSLRDITIYWHDLERLTRHWAQTYPQQFTSCALEPLLREPEPRIRQLLRDCRLEFALECLSPHLTEREIHTASATQVRRPLTAPTSNSSYVARYGELLAPLRQLLVSESGAPTTGAYRG